MDQHRKSFINVHNSFQKYEPVIKRHESFVNYDLSGIYPGNMKLYGHWITKLVRGNTWFGLNYDCRLLEVLDNAKGDFDTYVITCHNDPVFIDQIGHLCDQRPDSLFVIVGDISGSFPFDNCKILTNYWFHKIIPYSLSNTDIEFLEQRKYLLSSLVNQPSYYKTIVTSHLHKNYRDQNNLVWTWNTVNSKDRCNSMDLLDFETQNSIIDDLRNHYFQNLKNTSRAHEVFANLPISDFYSFGPIPQSWVNITNETFINETIGNIVCPGPNVTEKTWKPLMTGTAMIPQGQSKTYSMFENFGFEFNYPWDKSYDLLTGDYDRLLGTLNVIDYVMNNPDTVLKEVYDSCKYNFSWVRSPGLIKRIEELNEKYLEEFLLNY